MFTKFSLVCFLIYSQHSLHLGKPSMLHLAPVAGRTDAGKGSQQALDIRRTLAPSSEDQPANRVKGT